jgi:hypothetical protein
MRSLLLSRFRPRPHQPLRPEDRGSRTRAYTKATNGYEVRQKTFDTLELLQSILIHLSVKQLYSVQRVSSRFRWAILEETKPSRSNVPSTCTLRPSCSSNLHSSSSASGVSERALGS